MGQSIRKLIEKNVVILMIVWVVAINGADNFYISFNNKNLQTNLPLPHLANGQPSSTGSKPSGFFPGITSWLWPSLNYKSIKALILVYGISMGLLFYDVRTIYNKNNWSLWKEEVPLTRLKAISESQIYQELIQSIHTFYNQPLLPAIVSFYNDTAHELKRLGRFITLHTWITRLYLNHFFPHHVQELEHARLALKRIEYLRELLINNFGHPLTAQNLVGA